jgi:biopolymer transport protein ExbB
MFEAWYAVEAFVERGGDVIWAIAVALLLMWSLILERLWYLRSEHRAQVARVERAWAERREHRSWHAHQVRRQLVSEVSAGLSRGLGMIQTLVALCTLLGLLGTVTGMIAVFDTMAATGSSSARLMADGVSKATLPTMAGMVASLSGLFFSVWLQNRAKNEAERLADHLTTE